MRLLLPDNVVRGVFLGAVSLGLLAGLQTPPLLYVVLLVISSLRMHGATRARTRCWPS
jgi:hypothetical protein